MLPQTTPLLPAGPPPDNASVVAAGNGMGVRRSPADGQAGVLAGSDATFSQAGMPQEGGPDAGGLRPASFPRAFQETFQAVLDGRSLPHAGLSPGLYPDLAAQAAGEDGRFWSAGGKTLPLPPMSSPVLPEEQADTLTEENATAAPPVLAGDVLEWARIGGDFFRSVSPGVAREGHEAGAAALQVTQGERREPAGLNDVLRLSNAPSAGDRDGGEPALQQALSVARGLVSGERSASPGLPRGEARLRLDGLAETGPAFSHNTDINITTQGQQAVASAGLWPQNAPPAAERNPVSLMLQAPLQQQAQWGEEMGQQVRWLVSQKLHVAELKLNPPQLGAIEVRVVVQQDQVNLHFSSPHALVRDSIEESLPRLREILQGNGFNLVNVDVSHQDSAGQRHQAGTDFTATPQGGTSPAGNGERVDDAPLTTSLSHQGLLDLYA